MSSNKPARRGRGIDALFGSESAASETQSAASGLQFDHDDELNVLLAAETSEATENISNPPSTSTAEMPPSPIGRPEAAKPADETSIPAGSGVVISDEELFSSIDVPFNANAAADDLSIEDEIEVPEPAPDAPPPALDTGVEPEISLPEVHDVEPSPPSPPALPIPEPVIPSPSVPDNSFEPSPLPTNANADIDETTLPSRPRPQFTGALTEVRVSEADRVGPEAVRPPSPFEQRPDVMIEEPVAPNRTQQERQEVLAHVQQQRIEELNAQIDQLYRDIPKNISNRPDLASQAMGLLRQSRTILLEHPEDFVEAEYRVQQAQSLYNRIENSEMWGDRYGWRIFIYEIIVLAFLLFSFVGLLAFGDEFSQWLARLVGSEQPSEGLVTAVGFWSTIAWGGIGGVMGALFTLWMHISERQDFERQHTMWYIVQPILGIILGGVIFLILYTGLLSLQGGELAARSLAETPQLLPALLAFIAGFRPQFLFDLLTKIIKVLSPSESTPE